MGRRGEASFIIFFGSEARNLSAVIYNLVTCLWFPLIFINIHIPPFPFLLWVTAPWKNTLYFANLLPECVVIPDIWYWNSLPSGAFTSLWPAHLLPWVTRKAEAKLFSWFTAQVMPFPSHQCSVLTKLRVSSLFTLTFSAPIFKAV